MNKVMQGLATLTALEARERIARGELRSVELITACLERIAECDGEIEAWAFLDKDLALAQAQAADKHRQSGRPLGPLHGIPVGVKDIIDTAGMPTENGTTIDAGRRPWRDASVVAKLRAAGAVILGKTVTTECAFFSPGKTRNPCAPDRTPGGSSSGSAAAVASGMAPLAVGTQTAGSVIRPAAYCGIVGFKPSFGLIPRTGILKLSPPLDTVGAFGRTIEDVALFADALAGYDSADPDTRPAAPPELLKNALSEPLVAPLLGFVKTPAWRQVEPDCAQGFAELVETLGEHCDEIELPQVFAEAATAQRRLMLVGIAQNLRHYYERGREQLTDATRQAIEEGRTITAVDYLSALDWRDVLSAGLDEIFYRYDALITPAATGEAPRGLDSTGSPACCVLWTLTGVPTLTLPLLEGTNGLPVGVQLVGRRGYDGRFLRTARWLMKTLGHVA